MSETPAPHDTSIEITVSDGEVFRCKRIGVPRNAKEQASYWAFTDSRGVEYLGPPVLAFAYSRERLKREVDEWWEMKTSLGYAGVDAFAMRLRIENGVRDREN